LRALMSFEPVGDCDGATTIVDGIAEGELVGGAASTLCSLMGTPWEVDTRGRILLLAAPPRSPWLIGGSLLHLANAGKLQECAGICVTGLGEAGAALDQVDALLEPLSVPAVRGLALGSGPR